MMCHLFTFLHIVDTPATHTHARSHAHAPTHYTCTLTCTLTLHMHVHITHHTQELEQRLVDMEEEQASSDHALTVLKQELAAVQTGSTVGESAAQLEHKVWWVCV